MVIQRKNMIILVILPCINIVDPSGMDKQFNSQFNGRRENSLSVIFE